MTKRSSSRSPSAEAVRSPGRLLLYAAAVCVFVVAGGTLWALSLPWLGVGLDANLETGQVELRSVTGPAQHLPTGSRVIAIHGGGESFALEATDLVEEPDFFDDYADMARFFERQSVLARVLEAPEVQVELALENATAPEADAAQEAGGALTNRGTETFTVRPERRPLGDLPFVFWFQWFAGSAGFLIGTWVLVLSPRGRGARCFAAMGAMFLVFTGTAAIYSTRELALDGSWFRLLSATNLTGAILFGCALVALFLSYPRPLVSARWLWAIPAVMVPWLLSGIFWIAPNQDVGSRLPVLFEMVTAMGLALVQWFATRNDPRGRAALRWLGSAVILGCGLFVFLTAGVALLGWMPPIAQGYAFGFFLLMDVGLALGLRRHSLLGVDEWALRVLFWLGAGVALVVLDVLLVVGLGASRELSLGTALAICGLGYLPVRNWIWERVVVRTRLGDQALFARVLEAAFAPRAEKRARLWQELLGSVFDPLEVRPASDEELGEDSTVRIERQGVRLVVPQIASLPGLVLDYPWGGRALFTPRHRGLAEVLVQLMRRAEAAKEAFLRGVQEERQRIARDLHDHLGAHLLSGLYAESAEQAREGIRHALSDMRSVVHELTREEDLELDGLLADLRHEASDRLRAAGLELDWPLSPSPTGARISPRMHRSLTAALREVVSNVLRHAEATRVVVESEVRDGKITLSVLDDGIGIAQARRTVAAEGSTTPGGGAASDSARPSDTLDDSASPESSPPPTSTVFPSTASPSGRAAPLDERRAVGSGRGLANLAYRAEQLGGALRVSDLCTTTPELSEGARAWLAKGRGSGTLVALDLPLTELQREELAS